MEVHINNFIEALINEHTSSFCLLYLQSCLHILDPNELPKDSLSDSGYGIEMLEELIMHYVKYKSSSFKGKVNEQDPDVSAYAVREEWIGFKEYIFKKIRSINKNIISSCQMTIL